MAASALTNSDQDILCGCFKNNISSVWDQNFVSLAPQDSELEFHNKEVEELKLKVKDLLLDSAVELTDNIHFVNLLCRLGVSYHFKDEINEQLNRIFTQLPKLLEDNDYNLSTVANLFRVLRQYGYNATSDVLMKFKDGDGEFKKDIVDDVEGILCLYEACFLGTEGEAILDEALEFTKKQLEILSMKSSPHMQKHISNALMNPSHRTIERLDALHYISFYEKAEFANRTLLKFAKLDYNRLQLLYRKEIASISQWREDIDYVGNFPFARNRIIEAYMWTVSSIFEPQYSLARMFLSKKVILGTVLDDIYDSYGTINELRLFTAAWQRLTKDAGDELSQYMKLFYRTVLEDLENSDTKGCSCKTSYTKEMIKELARCYMVEANWKNERKAPSFDEYLKIGKVTSTYDIFTSAIISGIEDFGMKEMLWVRTDPQSAIGAKLICRLLNDINVTTDETKRDDFPKGIDCYIKQYGVSKDEAIERILKLLESKWKRMNEDLVNSNGMERILVKYNFNFARVSRLFYGGIDLYTYASNMKLLILSMFINPLPI